MKILGIDIGGTRIKYGIFRNEDGGLRLEAKASFATPGVKSGEQSPGDFFRDLFSQLETEGWPMDEFAAVGLTVPGPVTDGGIVHGCPNLGWGTVDVRQAVAPWFAGTVAVQNDANAACLGEFVDGAGQGAASGILVTVGTGVGAGVWLNGRILEGAFGAGGEIGHMPMNPQAGESRRCGCGKIGCLEQLASATGIIKNYEEVGGEVGLTAEQIFGRAKRGDAKALQAVDRGAEALGRALAFAACVVDPEMFLLGGGVSAAGDFYLSRVQEAYRANCYAPSRETRFALAELGNDAGMYGAAEKARAFLLNS